MKIKKKRRLKKSVKRSLVILAIVTLTITTFTFGNLVPASLAKFKMDASGSGTLNIATPITEIVAVTTNRTITPYEPFDIYFNINNFNETDINKVTLQYKIEISSANKLSLDLLLYFINDDGTETLVDSDYSNILKQSVKETHKYHIVGTWTNTENLDISYANVKNNIKIKTTNIQVINDI